VSTTISSSSPDVSFAPLLAPLIGSAGLGKADARERKGQAERAAGDGSESELSLRPTCRLLCAKIKNAYVSQTEARDSK
jgi:hypothetical protein